MTGLHHYTQLLLVDVGGGGSSEFFAWAGLELRSS
jgi:hypothetical protein